MAVQKERIRTLNDATIRPDAAYVLYWSQMNRRVESNHALAYAIELANGAGLPLLVYEGLTCTYQAANDRLHTFVLEGVPSVAKTLGKRGIGYLFYLRRRRSDANDVLYRLAASAQCLVTDDYPAFIAREHNRSVPGKIGIPYIAVDSSCVVPMSRQEKRNWGAYTIRPRIRRDLPAFLIPCDMPRVKVKWMEGLLSSDLRSLHTDVEAKAIPALVSACEINHSVPASVTYSGGYRNARKHLERFLTERLKRYAEDRNEPTRHATSELSPWLHFGHISSLEVALTAQDYAREHKLNADAFLEELIVRRELAFNFARFTENLETLGSLPDWCRKTMAAHAGDPRPSVYSREQFETASTYDPLWNATQKELLLRGKIHGYYRMYWGKKIIEWSPSYEDALRTMIEMHDIYALDGRDANTYTNILWCFGLHDRPWTERPIFGKLRYMSEGGMKRKTDTAAYIEEIAALEKTGVDPWRL